MKERLVVVSANAYYVIVIISLVDEIEHDGGDLPNSPIVVGASTTEQSNGFSYWIGFIPIFS
jgi:hypothetical protein